MYDYLTGEAVAPRRSSGRPSFKNAVSGFSSDFSQGEVWFEYAKGACMKEEVAFVPMPDALADGRMSFWNVCLELHGRRLYDSFLRGLTGGYIFFVGLLMLFFVVPCYIVCRKRYRKKRTTPKKPPAA